MNDDRRTRRNENLIKELYWLEFAGITDTSNWWTMQRAVKLGLAKYGAITIQKPGKYYGCYYTGDIIHGYSLTCAGQRLLRFYESTQQKSN